MSRSGKFDLIDVNILRYLRSSNLFWVGDKDLPINEINLKEYNEVSKVILKKLTKFLEQRTFFVNLKLNQLARIASS